MKILHTKVVKGEQDNYQALADAVIIRAVRDYRSISRMLRILKKRLLRQGSKYNVSERDYLSMRIKHYQILREKIMLFFRSDMFYKLCDLNGCELLGSLKKEAYQ